MFEFVGELELTDQADAGGVRVQFFLKKVSIEEPPIPQLSQKNMIYDIHLI
jgi:hypothetical protein